MDFVTKLYFNDFLNQQIVYFIKLQTLKVDYYYFEVQMDLDLFIVINFEFNYFKELMDLDLFIIIPKFNLIMQMVN